MNSAEKLTWFFVILSAELAGQGIIGSVKYLFYKKYKKFKLFKKKRKKKAKILKLVKDEAV